MPVKKGQLLFTIDPNLLSTTLLSAQAALESARAREISARNDYERAVPLARIDAISRMQLDQYTAEFAAAQAAVRSAEQQVRNAQLQVGYTRIYAPIDGIIAATNAHMGDYVGVGTQFSVLTTISNIDTVAVNVAIPMAQYLRFAAAALRSTRTRGCSRTSPCRWPTGRSIPPEAAMPTRRRTCRARWERSCWWSSSPIPTICSSPGSSPA